MSLLRQTSRPAAGRTASLRGVARRIRPIHLLGAIAVTLAGSGLGAHTVATRTAGRHEAAPRPAPSPASSAGVTHTTSADPDFVEGGSAWLDDPPGCIDGTDNSCPHIHLPPATGINGNWFIPITIDNHDPEPFVGDTITIEVEAFDRDDPHCCAFDVTLDRAPKPTVITCKTGDSSGIAGPTSPRRPAHTVITWTVPATGFWVVNVHAKGACGSPGGSEQTGWQGFTARAKPSPPTRSPTGSPSPSSSPSPTASASPSPGETADPPA